MNSRLAGRAAQTKLQVFFVPIGNRCFGGVVDVVHRTWTRRLLASFSSLLLSCSLRFSPLT